jgi:hypothetical protein
LMVRSPPSRPLSLSFLSWSWCDRTKVSPSRARGIFFAAGGQLGGLSGYCPNVVPRTLLLPFIHPPAPLSCSRASSRFGDFDELIMGRS